MSKWTILGAYRGCVKWTINQFGEKCVGLSRVCRGKVVCRKYVDRYLMFLIMALYNLRGGELRMKGLIKKEMLCRAFSSSSSSSLAKSASSILEEKLNLKKKNKRMI